MQRTCLTVLSLATLTGLGCESQPTTAESPMVTPTRLDHDPLDDVQVSEWWSDGRSILRLYPDGRYVLNRSTDPYSLPDQYGRWSKASYALIWLEPYDTPNHERIRATLGRTDGKLTLSVPGHDPMTALSTRPRAIEDHLFGTWTGSGGELELLADMQYVFAPATENDSPIRAAHQGSWQLDGLSVVLTPRPAGLGPYHYRLDLVEESLRLHDDDTEFTLAIEND